MTVQLMTGEDFSVNGRMQGTIKLCDEAGNFLGPQWRGDLASPQHQKVVIKELVEALQLFDPEGGATESRAKMLLWKISAQAQERALQASAAPAPFNHHEKPRIVVVNARLRDLAAEGWSTVKAFNRPTPQLFRFGSRNLAKLIPNATDTRKEIRVMDQDAMLAQLEDIADWVKVDKTGHDIPADPPEKVIKIMLSDIPTDMPQLSGVVTSPYCLPDGTIVSTPGYNPQSGWYLDPGDLEMPEVPMKPSLIDVSDAIKLIYDELLCDFMFATESDRVHALAMMLTPLCRTLYSGPTPMGVIEAPAPRSGKSLLAEIIGIVTTGHPPEMAGVPAREEDWVKDITSLLASGASMVCIDNVAQRVASPYFAYVLTSTEPSVRVFGSNLRRTTLPNRMTWLMTGNNPRFSEELAQRRYTCRIDTGLPNPATRSGFKHNPLRPWVKKNRGELLKALFVLIRNWMALDRQPGKRSLGGFEGHGQTVGGILAAADLKGFLDDHFAEAAQPFEDYEEWEELCRVWAAEIGVGEDNRATARQVADLMAKHHLVVEAFASGTRESAVLRVGREILPLMRDRRFGRYIIRAGGKHRTKMNVWMLEVADHETEQSQKK